MHELSRAEFDKTFAPPMTNVTGNEESFVDLWSYAEPALSITFPDQETAKMDVEYVYESGDKRWKHILIGTLKPDCYFVVVVDRNEKSILGHHLLDLRSLYGLDEVES